MTKEYVLARLEKLYNSPKATKGIIRKWERIARNMGVL